MELHAVKITSPWSTAAAYAFLKKQDAEVAAVTGTSFVEIVVGEVTIRVGSDVSEAALRRILRAVRST